MSENDKETNERMARLVPELKSKFATYPLRRQNWLDVAGSIENRDGKSEPAFIPHKKDPNSPQPLMKLDYAWGPGPKGFGYYHMLTRQSYQILNSRIRNKGAPANCCLCATTDSKEEAKDFDVVSDILYNRSIASKPDDILAVKEAIDIARGVARAEYNMDQNVQFLVMTTT